MTMPRMCLPGTTYLITRTVHNRQFLLTPSETVNDIVMYCVARAVAVTGVELHWIFAHVNHLHLGVTDREGSVSKFMQVMDRFIACCLIEHYKQLYPTEHLDGVWSKGKFSAVILANANAVMGEMAYSLCNAVKDGLVSDWRKWPGLCSSPSDWAAGVRYAARPEVYFDQRDEQWATVPCRFTVPPMLRDRPLEAAIDAVRTVIDDEQRKWQREHSGRGFAGVKAVLRTDPFGSPDSPRPKGRRNPTVAAGGDAELLREGIKLVRAFRERYREAWKAYRDGNLDALFPAGTLKMRLLHHAQCDVVHAPWCATALAPS